MHRAEVKEGTNVSLLMYVGVCVGKVHPFCFQTGHGWQGDSCAPGSSPTGRPVCYASHTNVLEEQASIASNAPAGWGY